MEVSKSKKGTFKNIIEPDDSESDNIKIGMSEKILRSASKLFSTRGYFTTSVEDIAKDAGVAKGSVYNYYESKSKIFEAVCIDGLQKLWSKLQQILLAIKSPEDMITAWVENFVHLIDRFPDLTELLMSDAPSGVDKSVFDETQAEKLRYMRLQADVLDYGQQKGYIKECDSLLFVHGFVGFAFEYYKAAKRQGKNMEAIAAGISGFIKSTLLK